MIARLLLQNTIFVVAMGALLFASAGTLHWPGAWVMLIVSAVLGPLCGWWLYRLDPALLAERLRPVIQRDQPPADKERDWPQLSTQTRARLSRLPTDKVIVSSEEARRFGFVQKQVRWQTNIPTSKP